VPRLQPLFDTCPAAPASLTNSILSHPVGEGQVPSPDGLGARALLVPRPGFVAAEHAKMLGYYESAVKSAREYLDALGADEPSSEAANAMQVALAGFVASAEKIRNAVIDDQTG
jgi:hypothetical protein